MQLLKDSLQAHPHLASSVQSLALGAWSTAVKQEATYDRPSNSRLTIELLHLIPSLCPRLRTLSWPGVVIADKAEAFSALQGLPPTIETLHLGDGSSDRDMSSALKYLEPALRQEFGSAHWSIEQVGAVVNTWPSLRKVVLREVLLPPQVEEEWCISSASSAWTCQLEEFELALGAGPASAMLELGDLELMLHGSRDSLRRFTVAEDQLSPQVLIAYLTSFGSSLTHLTTSITTNRLDSSESPPLLLLSTIASSCPSLRHLSLVGTFPDLSETLAPLTRLAQLETISLKLKLISALDTTANPSELVQMMARDFKLRGKLAKLRSMYLEVSSESARKVKVECRVWRRGRWLDWAEQGEVKRAGDVEVELRY